MLSQLSYDPKVRAVGVEPTRTLVLGILSPVRLPLRHARIKQDHNEVFS